MFVLSQKRILNSDEDLIAAYQGNNDLTVIEELFKRYSHFVYYHCQKVLCNEEDSKDAVMDIFIKLISLLKKHSVFCFRHWLAVVTRNHCLGRIRKQDRRKLKTVTFEELDRFPVENESDRKHFQIKEEKNILVNSALNRLKETQRHCIRMFYFERRSYHEIAVMMGWCKKKVKSYIQNGRKNLRKMLHNEQICYYI